MDAGNWLSDVGNAGRLFLESIPDAVWLVYSWARDWQGLLGGMLLVAAAWIFSQNSLRSARIRAAAMIRSAEIAANAGSTSATHSPVGAAAHRATRVEPTVPSPISPEKELIRRVEHMRSLIRSAMSTLTSDAEGVSLGPNFYCEKIALLRFGDGDLLPGSSAGLRDLYRKMVLQLALVRQAMEKKVPNSELSQVLVRLNGRARDLSAALAPPENTEAAAARK